MERILNSTSPKKLHKPTSLPTGKIRDESLMESVGFKKNSLSRLPMPGTGGQVGLAKEGEIISGKVIGTKGSVIFVDLGPTGTGIICGQEFQDAKESFRELKVGVQIFAKIIDLDNEDGYIELSPREANREFTWKTLQEKREKDETFKVKILGANKGGLLTKMSGIPAFLPVSHLSHEHYPRVEEGDKMKIVKELQKFVGEELEVKIFDVNPAEGKLILSEKARKLSEFKKIIGGLKVGAVVDGEITGTVDFGAFMKFSLQPASPKTASRGGPAAGAGPMAKTLLTNSKRQMPEAETAEFHARLAEDGPLRSRESEASESRRSCEAGGPEPVFLEGLIHISELDWRLIDDPAEFLKPGERVRAKIIEIDDNRISLSLKALKKNPWEDIEKKHKKGDMVRGKVVKFNPFGAFVQLVLSDNSASALRSASWRTADKDKAAEENGHVAEIQGLIHISEFGTEIKMKKTLELNKEYDFQILQIDQERHKIALKLNQSNNLTK